ncbi:MAG: TolC family protein [Phycisphaerae bacterium]
MAANPLLQRCARRAGWTAAATARRGAALLLTALTLSAVGCFEYARTADRDVFAAIEKRQQDALAYSAPIPATRARRPLPDADPGAYQYAPHPATTDVPAGFSATTQPAASAATELSSGARPSTATTASADPGLNTGAADDAATTRPRSAIAAISTQPAPERPAVFTLTDALAYALIHRREYQTAKEDLYLAALALTLERHLWTPQFAAELRSVYGNYGEISNFDQAMRFVADVSATQRLPYGGEFSARMINTLIRDIRQGITASETGQLEFGLNVPLLRDAGHVAREDLVQLERTLTYAVRDFERFRRRQLVVIASDYFDLLRAKQDVLDAFESLSRFEIDFERAAALEDAGTGTLLDTRRAEQEMLSAANRAEDLRESFRAQSDAFKLQIGMPVDEPLTLWDLEDIESIERQIAAGVYPILQRPPAADAEVRALEVATQRRFDLLNRLDQIDDAKRGVGVAKNQLLPDLDWTTTLTYDSDPGAFRTTSFSVARATWRSEVILALPLERTRERNQLKAALIDVNRARRAYDELIDGVRAEVRRAINRMRLEERSLEIQRRSVEVADLRREYARLQFYDGDIGYRDLQEAENDWTTARNRLNVAKTNSWRALLDFRLATETLQIHDDGRAEESPAEPADPTAPAPANANSARTPSGDRDATN